MINRASELLQDGLRARNWSGDRLNLDCSGESPVGTSSAQRTNKLGGSCSSELRKKFSFLPGRFKPEMGCSCSDSNEGHKHEHDLNDGDILRSPEQEEALRQKVSQVIASAAGC